MSFRSLGQDFFVMEPLDKTLVPVSSEHSHAPVEFVDADEPMECAEPMEIRIVVDEIPGAPPGTKLPEPEPELEVLDEDEQEEKTDENDAKKAKEEKWNWASKGAEGFVAWIKERLDNVPKHSGLDTAGIERAISYMERLDGEISKAMRLDIDGDLDANKIEEVRSNIDEGLDRLHERLDKIKKSKKSKRKKSASSDPEFIKEAQKISGVQGTMVSVPLTVSAIARICINGVVSAGKNLDDLFQRLASKYDLTKREQAEVAWLLTDLGFPLRGDRGFFPDDEVDSTSDDNFEWIANYPG